MNVALADGDGEAEIVERALDDDFGGEVDVAEVLVVAVEGLGFDLAVGVVDVLAPGEQIGAADVDDAQGAGDLALRLGEELDDRSPVPR